MEYTADEQAIIWLSACSGEDYRACVSRLRAVKIPSRLLGREQKLQVERFLRPLSEKGIFIVTICSDDYPESLKTIPDPPLILYGAGHRELLKKRRFCVVGSRITPPWAQKTGIRLAEELSRKFVIVTGLAEGGDYAAVTGALPSGNLISVLPCGILECYPAAHLQLKERVKKGGLLLSECPPSQPAAKFAFHARNRLLAALSEGVLVLSAGARSGTLITANCALEYGREVFALPHNLGVSQGAGCNELIKKGAYLVTETEDILSCYGMRMERESAVSLTEEESKVLLLLREQGELHTAQIAEQAGVQVYEAMAILSALEIKGCVVKSGGNQYSAL